LPEVDLPLQRLDLLLQRGLHRFLFLELLVDVIILFDQWLGLAPDLVDLRLDLRHGRLGVRLRAGHHDQDEGYNASEEDSAGSVHSCGDHGCSNSFVPVRRPG